MTRIFLKCIIIAAVIWLTSCSIPAPATPLTPSQDEVSTQVARMLTASPISTQGQQQTTQQPGISTEVPAPTQAPAPTEVPPTPEPTATSIPTQAPTSTPTEAPSPTTPASDPRLSLGDPTFQDTNFKENANWGPAWEDKYTRGEFKNHVLIMTSIGVDGWVLGWAKPSDFYMEMTAETGTCAGKDRYGMIVRVPETFDRGYLFGFTCDGRYSIRVWEPDNKSYEELVPWTKSSAIQAGSDKTNRLGIMAQGHKLSIYANGIFLDSVNDDRFDKGRFGPFIGQSETEDFTITISEISYWDLE